MIWRPKGAANKYNVKICQQQRRVFMIIDRSYLEACMFKNM